MTEFKVGDRVRLTGADWYGGSGEPEKGDIVEITRVDNTGIAWFEWGDEKWFIEDDGYDAELVTDEEERHHIGLDSGLVEALGVHTESISAFLDTVEKLNAIVPDHYAFPGGVRVHQISGHLTSFGGQAVQYIARSTRLDGNNKGDRVENLKKAQRMINLEIERLEAGE